MITYSKNYWYDGVRFHRLLDAPPTGASISSSAFMAPLCPAPLSGPSSQLHSLHCFELWLLTGSEPCGSPPGPCLRLSRSSALQSSFAPTLVRLPCTSRGAAHTVTFSGYSRFWEGRTHLALMAARWADFATKVLQILGGCAVYVHSSLALLIITTLLRTCVSTGCHV